VASVLFYEYVIRVSLMGLLVGRELSGTV